MKCHDMPEVLVSLAYGELDEQETAQAMAHIESCPACRAEWEDLQQTTQVLSQWEDITPERRHHFVEEQQGRLAGFREAWDQFFRPRKLAVGLPLAFGALLVLLSLLNFEAQYDENGWRIAFGVRPKAEAQSNDALMASFNERQRETIRLVSDMIEASEARQNKATATMMANYANVAEEQRKADLEQVGKGIEGLHYATQGQLKQNSAAIDNLLRMASYSLDREK